MRILSLGSLNFDYIYKVDHLVRSGETIAASTRNEFAGGKGLIQSISLAKAGALVCHAGKIGSDGIELRYFMKQFGVNTDFLLVDGIYPTGHAFIQVDPTGQSSIVTYGGANQFVTKQDIDGIMASFRKGDLLLLQNEISNLDYAIEKGHAMGLRVALNPSPIDHNLLHSSALRCVEWFLLNEIEGYEMTNQRDPSAICTSMRTQFPGSRVVLTLSSKGVVYQDDEISAQFGTYQVPVVDATGAGGTFIGYFLAAVMEELGVQKALELASKAAAISVSRNGSADSIPTRLEVEQTQLPLMAYAARSAMD